MELGGALTMVELNGDQADVEEYAALRNISITKAIEELVHAGLSREWEMA